MGFATRIPSGTTSLSALGTTVPSSPGKYIRTPAWRSRKSYTPKSVPRLKHVCHGASSARNAVLATSGGSSSTPAIRTAPSFASIRAASVPRPSGTGPPRRIAVFPGVRAVTTGRVRPNTPFRKNPSSSAARRVADGASAARTISDAASRTTSAGDAAATAHAKEATSGFMIPFSIIVMAFS